LDLPQTLGFSAAKRLGRVFYIDGATTLATPGASLVIFDNSVNLRPHRFIIRQT